jgi:putative ABC transport system permease protein
MRGGRAAGGQSRGSRRFQSALTIVQFALALMLLVGAGLLMQSYRQVQSVDVGFTPDGLLALHVEPPSPRYDTAPAVMALYDRLLAAVREVPGVSSAALANHAPLGNAGIPTQVRIAGRAVDTTGNDAALYKTVSVEYARVMDIPVLKGRWFIESDMTSSATGVVVSKTMASRFWPNDNPIGKSLTVFKSSQARPDFGEPVNARVVGVVGDVRHFGMESDPASEVYVPFTSEPWPHAMLLIRITGPEAAVAEGIRRAVVAVERDLPLSGSSGRAGIRPLTANIETLLASRSLMLSVIAGFAASALLLAALGIYGVTAYVVTQRTHEVGVRIALGATRERVIGMVLRRGVMLAVVGAVLGLVGALALTRLLGALLFATSPTDPVVFIGVAALLLVVSLLACYVPARRASRVDPVVALRAE